ncbi:trehalose-phosphate synthase Tps2 [Schizosaccharomyces osmophilus]|uniref:Trehalose-phosphate synthase Tps2 n=1 Tax=Schizosaccharomyces osmophilus TaxID=2545709 RepID=A0AAE9WCB4_9SCHI|nr:trehalose-phosphate synthase Tps2 [Schizosaccharomyces osmophilus]WBW72846.1 trehalose-phosphate synthase Tps2 [Schizosaccharomyces osmophilus]
MHSEPQKNGAIPYQRVINVSRNFQLKASIEKGSREWSFQPRSSSAALYSAIASLGNTNSPWESIFVASPGAVQVTQNETMSSPAVVNVNSSSNVLSSQRRSPSFTVFSPADQASFYEKACQFYKERNIVSKIVPVWGKLSSKFAPGSIQDPSEFLNYASNVGSNRLLEGPTYADNVLWDVLHYRIPTIDGFQQQIWWKDFNKWTQYFADYVVSIYRPGDLILIHDYSLFLLPKLIRKRLPDANIVFFLHVPFCTSEIFRCLPKRAEILNGVLASNVIGFQTDSYARHFLSTCVNALGLEATSSSYIDTCDGFRAAILSSHVNIDVPHVYSICNKQSVQSKVAQLRHLYHQNMKVIVGRDRLDKVCGIIHKLRAFRQLLIKYPHWRKRVILIQITSSTVGNSNSDLEMQVENLVTQINSEYGSLDYVPIHHFHQLLSVEEYFALLSAADVACVSSIRDAMNTMALEFVACQKKNKGSLILSEFSGTAEVLVSASVVNPYDYAGFADTINECLRKNIKEREQKFSSLWMQATSQSSQQWIYKLISRSFNEIRSVKSRMTTPSLTISDIQKNYKEAKKRLFILDYDGTLIQAARNSLDAAPTDRVLRTLKRLVSDSRNIVWVLSGRSKAFMGDWMDDISELGLSSEHGSIIRPPMAGSWYNNTEKLDLSWKDTVRDIFQYYVERTQGSYIEEKRNSLSWCFQNANSTYCRFQSLECQANLEGLIRQYDIEISPGRFFLEVHPNYLNKGALVKRILKRTGRTDFIFCAGDDRTDENMFEVFLPMPFDYFIHSSLVGDDTDYIDPSLSDLEDKQSHHNNANSKITSYRVHIGLTDTSTLADYHLPSPKDLVDLLLSL